MKAPDVPLSVALVALGAGAVLFYVWRKGGVSQAATAVGSAAVQAATGAATGVVGGLGEVAGLPLPSDTTTDPRIARWLIDREGWLTASQWSGLPALWAAMSLPAGSGVAPAPGTKLYAAFPPKVLTLGDFTRLDHDTTTAPVWTYSDPSNPNTWGLP